MFLSEEATFLTSAVGEGPPCGTSCYPASTSPPCVPPPRSSSLPCHRAETPPTASPAHALVLRVDATAGLPFSRACLTVPHRRRPAVCGSGRRQRLVEELLREGGEVGAGADGGVLRRGRRWLRLRLLGSVTAVDPEEVGSGTPGCARVVVGALAGGGRWRAAGGGGRRDERGGWRPAARATRRRWEEPANEERDVGGGSTRGEISRVVEENRKKMCYEAT